MVWTLAGMSEREYARGPFWAFLPRVPGSRRTILGIENSMDERADYAMLSARHGNHYQFLLLNDDALAACQVANIALSILGSFNDADLSGRPSALLTG